MKKGILSLVILGLFASTSSVVAYGGCGFPPGYYDNIHPRPGLVCVLTDMKLPNGRIVSVPRCKVVKNTMKSNTKERINNFFDRVWNGGHQ